LRAWWLRCWLPMRRRLRLQRRLRLRLRLLLAVGLRRLLLMRAWLPD
jgi:hypothetical protein